MFFDQVQLGAPDVMYHLKVQADSDQHPDKVDLGIGIYRNEQGKYHHLEALQEARAQLFASNPDHDYEVTTGNAEFLENSARIIFGQDARAMKSGSIASVQAISGTGSLHLAAMLLARSVPSMSKTVYLGVPAWGNYQPLFKLAGEFDIQTYQHYDASTGTVNWDAMLKAVDAAPKGSIFILQACCHNPTAADLSKEQWQVLAEKMKARNLFPVFDIAYQGLGNGLDEDAYCVRYFTDMGFEMAVCQSFAKNLGLYGERVGALHAVCPTKEIAVAVRDQLRFIIRSEFSSSPAYGSRLVNVILSDPSKEATWRSELQTIPRRLHSLRSRLYRLLSETYQTPGDWSVITRGTGLFSLLPLSPAQCNTLQNDYHIYMVSSGRVTISGLNDRNLDYVAKSIDTVVRAS